MASKKNKIVPLGENFHDFIDILPINIFWKDVKGTFVGCNTSFAKSFGFTTTNDVIGKNDFSLPVNTNSSSKYKLDDQKVMETKTSMIDIEETQTLKDGTTKHALTSKVPLIDKHNNCVGVLGLYSDISERKEQEKKLNGALKKLEHANQAKSTFIANMGHDIRTPLSGIIGLSELLQEQTDLSTIREYSRDIHNASKVLMSLCNEILETSMLNSYEKNKKLSVFCWRTLLDETIEVMRPTIKKKNLFIKTIYQMQGLNKHYGAQLLLRRILTNLISNAIKFTQHGGITIETQITHHPTLKDHSLLTCSVTDTGIGIPDAYKPLAFDSFQRGTPSYQSKYEGSGLGLYIVKSFIDQLSGTINLKSTVGEGSTFTFNVPLQLPHANQENTQPHTTLSQEQAVAHGLATATSILFVEDNKIAQKIGVTILENLGFNVDLAKNGQEAIAALKRKKYDLLYLDIGLPDISGNTVAKEVRRPDHINHDIFITALTAHASLGNTSDYIDKDLFNSVICKPLTKNIALDLAKKIHSARERS